MNVSLTLRTPELERLFFSAAPLRIDLSNAEAGKRVIDIESLKKVELVAGEGIRIIGSGKITWPVLGFTIPVTLDAASVMLLPSAEHTSTGALALRLRIVIENANVPMIPEFAEISVVKKVNDALATSTPVLDLDLRKLLSLRAKLPSFLEPASFFLLHLTSLDVSVESDALHIAAVVGGDLEREPTGPYAPPLASDGQASVS